MKPFHLSIVVPDLVAIRGFYLDVLQCKLGRDKGSWIDILFFEHQLTFHQENECQTSMKIDHFGPVLDKDVWEKMAKNVERHNIQFVMAPKLVNEGDRDESGKFLITDPAGNLLEFKYYANFGKTVEDQV